MVVPNALGWETEVSNGTEPKLQLVEQYRRYADLSVEELWWRYFGLGGMSTLLQFDEFLQGSVDPTPNEYNIMAVALNERFMEFDPSRSIPYIEDRSPSSN